MEIREMITTTAHTQGIGIAGLFTQHRIGGLPRIDRKRTYDWHRDGEASFLEEKTLAFLFFRTTRLFGNRADSVRLLAQCLIEGVQGIHVDVPVKGEA